ncbi:MAG: serine hydrolase [Gammaproteobacteria bacterium]|nr:serine hydrolase [Gammaproteobacteria bacterium]
MNKILKLLSIGLFCLISHAAIANSSPVDLIVKPAMTQFMNQYAIPGAAVLIYHDGHMYAYYFGVSNLKSNTPVTGQTIFELGSITKTFTGLLLAEGIQSGSVKLSTPLGSLLRTGQNYSTDIRRIPLLDLATHTSSLPDNVSNIAYNAPANSQTQARLNRFLNGWHAPYPMGSREIYSNFAFGLLGIALADHAHKSLAQLMKNTILLPLGMKNSGLFVPVQNYAEGYSADGKPVTSPQVGLLAGAWAMKASVNDMQAYLKAAMLLPGTPPNILTLMKSTQMGYFRYADYPLQNGLGWQITPLANVDISSLMQVGAHYNHVPMAMVRIDPPVFVQNSLIDKTGTTDGFRAYIGVLPERQDGIVIMINRSIANSGAMLNQARKILFALD